MAFCEQCGTKVNGGEKFCHECGAQISAGQNNAPQTSGTFVTPSINLPINEAQEKPKTMRTVVKVCVKCGKELEHDWLICPYCKTEAGPKICAACGKESQETWVVCPFCKTEL